MARERIRQYTAEFKGDGWSPFGDEKCNELLKKKLIEMAPEIFVATFGNMFQNAVSAMKRY